MARAALRSELGENLLEALKHDPAVAQLLSGLETEVVVICLTPSAAARRILPAFRGGCPA